ncbi:bifunctional folylpolyglutamate synthase/dihydrofolate synthase [Halobacillus naozhouensis]|uniref:tetrahydrofolate synthase n=1 Tax=Halobacillus naozhouensis TaxID=554880 RepID=A0ABY8ITN2_9BACI|nr:folylpolyglutamate synthase/dihydrofolate synthase family protein [Halobacillus naozhouensis]WFT73395.1 bifunctional folylpolyglutamate synthase/dihydrofolate synthase [Halobacillus naozhouensis]
MNYDEALQWIHSREKFKVKPGLNRMKWMMEKLGHPEKKITSIHIAGTNGKGSTLTFLRNLVQKQGYTAGSFTSPYITRFNERISVNGNPIDDEELANLVLDIQPLAEQLANTVWGEPTEFEVITAMAILYFSRQPLDFVLFEAGLGGRMDSTNIIHPALSIITNIGLDHMGILGDSYEQIAYEKAGIIKEKTHVITGAERDDVLHVIKHKAAEQHAPLFTMGESFTSTHLKSVQNGEYFSFSAPGYGESSFFSPLKGEHQVKNASLALYAMELLKDAGYKVDRSQYKAGIESTFWPARFERVSEQPQIILDGAHNQEGTKALVETMIKHYDDKRIIIMYAALLDKPVKEMLAQLKGIADELWVTHFDFPKAMEAEEISQLVTHNRLHVHTNYKQALEEICPTMNESDVLLITGSLYFISAIRKFFE